MLPGHSRRPAGQSSVAARTEPSQQTTGTGGDGFGAGHASPTGTPTGEPGQNRCGSGHWSAPARTDPSGQVTEVACGGCELPVGLGAGWSVRVADGFGQGVAATARLWGRAGAALSQGRGSSQPGAGDDPAGQGGVHCSPDGSSVSVSATPHVGAGHCLAGTPADAGGQAEKMESHIPAGPRVMSVGQSAGSVEHAWSASAVAPAGHSVGPGAHPFRAPDAVPLGHADGLFVGLPDGLAESESPGPPVSRGLCSPSALGDGAGWVLGAIGSGGGSAGRGGAGAGFWLPEAGGESPSGA